MLTLVATVALVVGGCTISKPKAPTWDSDFTIPLVSHTYDMLEIVDRIDEDALLHDSLGQLALSFKCKMSPAPIMAELSLRDTVGLTLCYLGTVVIVPPQPKTITLSQLDFLPPTSPGERVPGFNINEPVKIPVMETFESAIFAEGKLMLSIINQSDFPLSSLRFSLVDGSSQSPIAEFEFATGLAPGETGADTVDIGGKTFSSHMSLAPQVSSPGGVYSGSSGKYIEITLAFSEQIRVSSGKVAVAPQSKDFPGRIEITHRHRFLRGTVDTGRIDIEVVNRTALAAGAHIVLNEIRHYDSPLTIDTSLAPRQVLRYQRDIGGYELVPDDAEGAMTLNVGIRVNIIGTGAQRVQVDADSQYQVTAGLVAVHLSRATGVFAPTQVSLPDTTFSLQVPKGFGNVSLPDAFLTISAYSEVDLPVRADLAIDGLSGRQVTAPIVLTRGSCNAAGRTQIVVADLKGLTTPLPNEITISGSAVVGDSQTIGTVCEQSRLWGEIEIRSPLRMVMDTSEFWGNVNWTLIDQKNIDDVSDRLISARMYTTLTNHLPLAAEIYLHLAGDSTALYDSATTDLIVGPFRIAAALTDTSGMVVDSTVSNVVTELSEQDLKIIRRPVLYVGSHVHLNGTEGKIISIIPSDYLAVQSHIKVTTRMGGDR